jgi:type II secretory pathway pseudopilin PulG
MIVSIIIVLIVALIVIALWVSAVQQRKEKQEIARRRELTKLKAIIEESEDALVNNAGIPLSEGIIRALQKRSFNALNEMVALSPSSNALKNRLAQAKELLTSTVSGNNSDNIALPNNDKQLIGIIQGIKKLRSVLRSEQNKGQLDSQTFSIEDKRLEKLQLKINIESQIKRGVSARSASMVGSARQYFEKAHATLIALTYTDDYIEAKRQEVEGYLNTISLELKNSNEKALKKKAAEEQDDLDVLFAPKKKW